MSRSGMDKPAVRLPREKQFRVRVPIGAICITTTCSLRMRTSSDLLTRLATASAFTRTCVLFRCAQRPAEARCFYRMPVFNVSDVQRVSFELQAPWVCMCMFMCICIKCMCMCKAYTCSTHFTLATGTDKSIQCTRTRLTSTCAIQLPLPLPLGMHSHESSQTHIALICAYLLEHSARVARLALLVRPAPRRRRLLGAASATRPVSGSQRALHVRGHRPARRRPPHVRAARQYSALAHDRRASAPPGAAHRHPALRAVPLPLD